MGAIKPRPRKIHRYGSLVAFLKFIICSNVFLHLSILWRQHSSGRNSIQNASHGTIYCRPDWNQLQMMPLLSPRYRCAACKRGSSLVDSLLAPVVVRMSRCRALKWTLPNRVRVDHGSSDLMAASVVIDPSYRAHLDGVLV